MDVTEEDWDLARVMKRTSDAVRRHAQTIVAEDERAKESQTSARLARRQVAGAAAVEGWRTVEAAKRIKDKVEAEPGVTVSKLRRKLQSKYFEYGLDHALSEKWVEERLEPGQGQDKRALYPGEPS